MASKDNSRYLIPPQSDGPSSVSWSPLEKSQSADDRAYIQYQPAGQDTPVGLGISSDREYPHDDITTKSNSNPPSTFPSPGFSRSPTLLLDHHHHDGHGMRCPTKKTIIQKRLSWVPLTILVLAIYATAFSGFYLVIALLKPRYGTKTIGEDGNLAPSTATLLSALFAKTIELSYVTVCVAFLGQVLSRRAITKGSRGISISDMSMRSWIMQPGSLIVHWETLKYSAWTILGAITLTATIVAMLYTTAAEALVSPKLIMGPIEDTSLTGNVSMKFANPQYLALHCQTPITDKMDPDYRGTTCLEMQHVSQAYHNYQAYLVEWSHLAMQPSGGPTDLAQRPPPSGSLYDNTTVTGSWINRDNMTELSDKHNRMVNNVTAAMPHGGIIAAAKNPINEITQPVSTSGEGNFEIEASVPSPAINVLCAAMNESELAPLVYTAWPNINDTFDPITWYAERPSLVPAGDDWLNRTVVDDLFSFGPKYGQHPPIFGKFPKPYNTLLNVTGKFPANSIYLLGAHPDNTTSHPYILCALKAKQSPLCSTKYSATSSGASLSTHCEDPANPMQYNKHDPDALDGEFDPDWKNIGSEWANSLALGTGITDAASSNARLLTQLIPSSKEPFGFDPKLPSIAEALAVLAGSTLIMSSTDTPFKPSWPYEEPALETPVQQSFPATFKTIAYASGNTEAWQGIFYTILVFAFLTSAVVLAFMVFEVRGKQITDFTEPQNLFALALGSPFSGRLKGACGGGPEGGMLGERWVVGMREGEEHWFIGSRGEKGSYDIYETDQEGGKGMNDSEREVHNPGERSRGMESIQVEDDEGVDVGKKAGGLSPAMEEYRMLSGRRSFLSRFY